MIEEKLVQPLDYSRLEGMENIDPRFLDMSFDPGNHYSVPYFWGTLGIVYNDKFIEEDAMRKWSDLWDPSLENSVMMIDGAREVIGIGLNTLGYSLNSTDDAELNEAVTLLRDLMPNVKALVADEIKMYMINEETPVAITFSGEAADMMYENEHIHYVIPEEGSNLWFDNIVIPHNAKNVQGAYDFINFMLRPEVAAQNAEYIGYSTPNQAAMALLPPEITEDEQFYPNDELIARLEVYENLGPEYISIYNDLFLELKMYRQ